MSGLSGRIQSHNVADFDQSAFINLKDSNCENTYFFKTVTVF